MTLSPRTAHGLILLSASVATGTAFRLAAVALPGRLDATVGAGVLLLVASALAAGGVVRLPPRVWQLAVPAVGFTAALLWRDSPVLFGLNLLGFGSVLLLLLPHARAPRVARAGVTDYARAGLAWAGAALAGPLPLAAREVRWSELSPGETRRPVRRVAVGLAAAVPCCLLFGSLFRAADPAYDRFVGRLVGVDLGPVVDHAAPIFVWAWLVAGYLWLAFRAGPTRRLVPRAGRAGGVEVVTALGTVLVLFLGFMALQASYLFGGETALRAMGLTYAEYARRGFFELVAVAVLSIPMLLAADWALAPGDAAARRRLRWVVGAFCATLFVLLASALDRMRLYTGAYGLTELRLYTTAFMAWVSVVLGWLIATVLRGRRGRFAWGAVVSGWLVIGALNLINPDALIVATNARRASGLDAAHAAGLSADAIPAVIAAAAAAAPAERCRLVESALRPLVSATAQADRWTLGRAQALRAAGWRPPPGCASRG